MVAVDGDVIRGMGDLILTVSLREVGEQVIFAVVREGEEIETTVTLAARPDGLAQ